MNLADLKKWEYCTDFKIFFLDFFFLFWNFRKTIDTWLAWRQSTGNGVHYEDESQTVVTKSNFFNMYSSDH